MKCQVFLVFMWCYVLCLLVVSRKWIVFSVGCWFGVVLVVWMWWKWLFFMCGIRVSWLIRMVVCQGMVDQVCLVLFVVGLSSYVIVSMFSLQSRYIGIVSMIIEVMFGGVMKVVMVKVLMMVQWWLLCSFCRFIMLIVVRIIIVIGILKYRLKVKNISIMKLRQWVMLVIIFMFCGVIVVRK